MPMVIRTRKWAPRARGAIQSEVDRAKSDGSENWPSICGYRNRAAFLMQTRASPHL